MQTKKNLIYILLLTYNFSLWPHANQATDILKKCVIQGNCVQNLRLYYSKEVVSSSEAVVFLVAEQGADVNAKVHSGFSLLHKTNDPRVARELIRAGANVNAKSDIGLTPLHGASAEITELLISAGADVNAASGSGLTPLLLSRDTRVIGQLLSAGADPNAKNQFGFTLLHYTEDLTVARALLLAAATVVVVDQPKLDRLYENGLIDRSVYLKNSIILVQNKCLRGFTYGRKL